MVDGFFQLLILFCRNGHVRLERYGNTRPVQLRKPIFEVGRVANFNNIIFVTWVGEDVDEAFLHGFSIQYAEDGLAVYS